MAGGKELGVKEQGEVLQAFSRMLDREAHILIKRPALLWQQLYNRLQWEEENTAEITIAARKKRNKLGEKPWIRSRTPFRESKALIRTLTGHTSNIIKCAFSPNGQRIISASEDGLKIWEAASGREMHNLTGQSDKIKEFVISPDGQRIVSASDHILNIWEVNSGRKLQILPRNISQILDKAVNVLAFSPDGDWIVYTFDLYTIKIWDVINERELHTLTGHRSGITGCAFSPDGQKLVSASSGVDVDTLEIDATIKIWDAASGRELYTLPGHKDGSTVCNFSPDGKWIVSASEDRLTIWEAISGREFQSLPRNISGFLHEAVKVLAFSPDGEWIAYSCKDETLKIWDLINRRELYTLKGHTKPIQACAFSPDGQMIVTGSADACLKIWDAASGCELHTLSGHTGYAYAFGFSPDGQMIVSEVGKILQVWDISVLGNEGADSRRQMSILPGHQGDLIACAFSPNGQKIVSASSENVKICDADSGRGLHTFTGKGYRITTCVLSPDRRNILTASPGLKNTFQIWDAASGNELRSLTGNMGNVTTCALSPNGQRFISGDYDSNLKIWDVASGHELHTLRGFEGNVNICAFSPDGQRIVSSSHDSRMRQHNLKIWDVVTGRELHTLIGHKNMVYACAFSPDGQRIVSSETYYTTLIIWDAASGRKLHTLTRHKDWVRACAFNPDGEKIVSASMDKTLKIWDVISGRELHTLTGHTEWVSACAFSPDGKWVISASWDGTLRIWGVTSGREKYCIPLLGKISIIDPHPWKAAVACGDEGGNLYLLDLVGITYSPIIIAVKMGRKGLFKALTIQCPACQKEHVIKEEQLGSEMTCPTPGCGLKLKLNPFVIQMK